jgi:hypothetical protein
MSGMYENSSSTPIPPDSGSSNPSGPPPVSISPAPPSPASPAGKAITKPGYGGSASKANTYRKETNSGGGEEEEEDDWMNDHSAAPPNIPAVPADAVDPAAAPAAGSVAARSKLFSGLGSGSGEQAPPIRRTSSSAEETAKKLAIAAGSAPSCTFCGKVRE